MSGQTELEFKPQENELPRHDEALLRFLLAGRALVTLRSVKTGKRYTYRVQRPKEDAPHFVSVLYGPDNDTDYRYIGTIFESKTFRRTDKSKLPETDQRFVAWAWFWRVLWEKPELPDTLEVFHEGRCGRCGRTLTVPSSIETGLGPKCAAELEGN